MLRCMKEGTGYEQGKRSKTLLKVKDFQDGEFLVVDVQRGKRNERLDTEVAIFVCETADKKQFNVTAPGTAQEKDHYYHHAKKLYWKRVNGKVF